MQRFSPYNALKGHAAHDPETEAIIIGDLVITRGEFLERVVGFAAWLVDHGFEPGKVTGLCIRDEVGHLVCAMALLCLDTPHIGLGSHEAGTTKRALAVKVGVTQLVVEQPEDWMEGLEIFVAPIGDPAAIAAAPAIDHKRYFVGRSLDAVGVYQNTSGSTNVPKTFGFTLERLRILSDRYATDARERRALRTGSIEFDAHRLSRICSLIAGNTAVFIKHLNLRDLVAVCNRAAVSTIHMGAYKLASLIRAETSPSSRLPSFTMVQTGGSRVPGRLREELTQVLTDNLWVLYATSEVGMISMASPDQHECFPEGVGFPAQNVDVEVVGPSGEGVASGEIGQIRVRKAGMASGYVAEPGTGSNFENGWFYPRDLVSLRDGEPLIFHGRADDVMILNGLNIFPSAIEDTLESHPDVKEAVAYPVKSRIYGEIPVAAVVLKDGVEERDVSRLMDLCRCVLGIRAPRQIVVVDQIPRNAAGKALRRELSSS
jgi:long-chain acyl-CoA synthetase